MLARATNCARYCAVRKTDARIIPRYGKAKGVFSGRSERSLGRSLMARLMLRFMPD